MSNYLRIRQILQTKPLGEQVEIRGWLRTRRDSKGEFSFLEINDGSCLANLQVIADRSLPNFFKVNPRLCRGTTKV